MNNESYMELAIEEARKAKASGDLPFGAVVVCDNKVVGRGKCEERTGGDVLSHAELLAVRETCKNLGRNNLQDCTIYCTNEPCLMCAAGIFQANISNVVIGLSRDDLPQLLRSRNIRIDDLAIDSKQKINIVRGVLKNKIKILFKDIISE